MNNTIRRVWNQNRMVNIEDLRGMAFQAEDGGHTFEISGINDAGESVPLSGTVAGVFMRPDGADVALTGDASDGVVSVTLSDACYAVAGRFGLTIFVTADSKKTCVYACIGTVAQTSYGAVAGDTPQSVVDLINAINAAIASIPADYTDLMAAIAPTYSDQSVYPAGAYRWYNGVLYKSKVAITTAESFTAAHWETVSISDDVSQLLYLKQITSGIAGVLTDETASYSNKFINSNNVIAGATNFDVYKYAVQGGVPYIIYGEQIRINNNVYPLCGFSASDYTGGTSISMDIMIVPSGETAVKKDYNITFIPPSDGYVYINHHHSYPNAIQLYTCTQSEKESSIINELTNSERQIAVKLQAFGDSITDDSWRSDGTTWLTILPKIYPQRTWDISNDAVGGSHMGHGRVNSDTGKYHELQYNFVYDLITNENIFKPDSDIIVIFCGTNDFNSSPLGQYGDTTTDTFYGACHAVCEYLSQHTSALVCFVTPIARPYDVDTEKSTNADGERINSYGASLRDYADAIKRVCAFYQFPVIDLFYEIGWNKYTVKAYLDNVGVHPSYKGSKRICQFITSALRFHMGV